MRVNYSAPGKLFISGEWSILEPGNVGMVAAVNSRSFVSIEPLAGYNGISVSAEDFKILDARAKFLDGRLVFMNLDDKSKETLKLLSEAISTALRYLNEKNIAAKPFKISASSKDLQVIIEGKPKKVGFGSSAAVVAATIAAVLDFHGYKASRDETFKLATLAHYSAQGKIGSGFDVAASVYGSIFVYSRFDPDWLQKRIGLAALSELVSENWPGLLIEGVDMPDNFRLLVGWTRDEASTSAMIKQMNEFKEKEKEKYSKAVNNVAESARSVVEAWKEKDFDHVLTELQNNRQSLAALGKISGVNIQTKELERLADIADRLGAAGKLSGAGGGDCGIAVCFDGGTAEKVRNAWKDAGITVLENTIDMEGVRKE